MYRALYTFRGKGAIGGNVAAAVAVAAVAPRRYRPQRPHVRFATGLCHESHCSEANGGLCNVLLGRS